MIIVGELINTSRKVISKATADGDAKTIQAIAKNQAQAGAHYIDVNAGTFVDKEPEYLKWLVSVVQEAVDIPCCIDSPSPAAIEAALSVHRGIPMINSISLEKNRYDGLMPILAGTDFKVAALCISDERMPETVEDRLSIAEILIDRLTRGNVRIDNIFIDPLVQPVSTKKSCGSAFLDSVEQIIDRFKGVHTMCGMSNISYGLPLRKLLNRTFIAMAVARGLDGAIIDPLDRDLTSAIYAAEALIGKDDFCMNYIRAFRSEKIG